MLSGERQFVRQSFGEQDLVQVEVAEGEGGVGAPQIEPPHPDETRVGASRTTLEPSLVALLKSLLREMSPVTVPCDVADERRSIS
jgi:hypothetical protein